MSSDFGFTDLECKIIKSQIARRAKYRQEFLKAKSNPCIHMQEPGAMFEPAIQRFMSMKATQLEHFTFNPKTITFGICSIILPMSIYGYAVWTTRQKYLQEIRCGQLKPKDRLFKFA